ncbi:hypothetical protein B296_00009520 [Ensete ventricosum]|uniref:Uncharacterized protein n=1 Tax=Ensete ventricosum TaxID=4639 RepID=A0A427BAF1_ENSVE|nr:hypothetical protein B296_00009520 [Ensete ventricosum]
MLVANVGESDAGILLFSRGCPPLQKLELRSCFSEPALAMAAMQLPSLRYLWNIEFIPPRQDVADNETEDRCNVEYQAQILAYYSLAGERTDCICFKTPFQIYIPSQETSAIIIASSFTVIHLDGDDRHHGNYVLPLDPMLIFSRRRMKVASTKKSRGQDTGPNWLLSRSRSPTSPGNGGLPGDIRRHLFPAVRGVLVEPPFRQGMLE